MMEELSCAGSFTDKERRNWLLTVILDLSWLHSVCCAGQRGSLFRLSAPVCTKPPLASKKGNKTTQRRTSSALRVRFHYNLYLSNYNCRTTTHCKKYYSIHSTTKKRGEKKGGSDDQRSKKNNFCYCTSSTSRLPLCRSSTLWIASDMTAIIDEIRRNNPRTFFVELHLSQLQDGELTEALEQNPYLTQISIHACGGGRRWPLLRKHLATREKLTAGALHTSTQEGAQEAPSDAEIDLFLKAFQRNKSIGDTALAVKNPLSVSSIVSFLDASVDHITEFSLFCEVKEEGGDDDDGPEILAAAFKRCTKLECLELPNLQEPNVVAILNSIRILCNPALTGLNVDMHNWSNNEAAHNAFQRLLRTSTSLRKIEFWGNAGRRPKEYLFYAIGQNEFQLALIALNGRRRR